MSKTLTLGSLFDGIGGWLIAAKHAGVKPIWASEIEPFPMAVTAHHFPEVKQLGDITKINLDELEPCDILTAGSPCQDLSIAGLRKGLNEGERSGLFRVAVDIVRYMRLKTNGKYPRWFVWENVPGAFSSNKGMDFRAVLEEIGQTDIPMPPGNKWANSGLVQCDNCEIAWRVLNADGWGVPQRRRRIFLVADFTAKVRRAGEVLFVEEGLSGNPTESGSEGEETPRAIADGIGTASECSSLKQAIFENHSNDSRITGPHKICPTLTQRMGTGGNNVPLTFDVRFTSDNTSNWRANVYETDTSRTLSTGNNAPDGNQGGVAIVERPK